MVAPRLHKQQKITRQFHPLFPAMNHTVTEETVSPCTKQHACEPGEPGEPGELELPPGFLWNV